jgi:putative transcriptional regulator
LNKVAEGRLRLNKTQFEMSRDLEISSDYLSMIERGIRTPGFLLSRKLADYLGTTVDELFFNTKSNNMFE